MDAGLASFVLSSVLYRSLFSRRRKPFTWLTPPSITAKLFHPPAVDHADLKQDGADDAGGHLMERLKNDGYVVVRGCLSRDDVEVALDLVWSYVERASEAELELLSRDTTTSITAAAAPVDRNKPETWTDAAWPACVEGGILPYYGSGHSKAAWFVRSLPNVQDVFKALHNCSDLCTSFDGMVVWRKNKANERGWFHIDQNPMQKPEFCSVQGLVNLVETTAETGGNVLVRGSQRLFPEHYVRHYQDRLAELGGDDWLEVAGDDGVLREACEKGDIVMAKLLPGDVLLWDSRVIHCSFPGSFPAPGGGGCSGHSCEKSRLTRAAVLVTMVDAAEVSSEVRELRKAAVDTKTTLTHWVTKAAQLGAERCEEVLEERRRVNLMGDALCSVRDLSANQRALI
jgi:hypothetical protein